MKMKRGLVMLWLLMAACSDDPTSSGGARAYIAVATGGEHSCAVAQSGDAYCWGRGIDGELGIGVKENRASPTLVTGNLDFKDITAGDAHTCALATDGRVYCWGWNAFFQRGNPTAQVDADPVPVASPQRFTAVSAGAHHTCAIGVDSLAYCWGNNRYGQLGDGSINLATSPKFVSGQIHFETISSGAWHTCGVTFTGTAFCWGRNDFGQLGVGSDQPLITTPRQVVAGFPFAQVDAGETHTCGVATDRNLYCWGSNEFGELGTGSAFKPGLAGAYTPTPTSGHFLTADFIAAGSSHTCASATTGSRCWGRGLYGQIGNGATNDQFVPQPVQLFAAPISFSALAAGGWTHACGIIDRSVYCWGTGHAGQLGVPNNTFASQPQRVGD